MIQSNAQTFTSPACTKSQTSIVTKGWFGLFGALLMGSCLLSAPAFAQSNYQPQQTSTTSSPSVKSSFNQSSSQTTNSNGSVSSQYSESQTTSTTRNANSNSNAMRVNGASAQSNSSVSNAQSGTMTTGSMSGVGSSGSPQNSNQSAAYRAAWDECSSQAGLSAAEKQAMSNNQNSSNYTGDGRPMGQTMGGSMEPKSPAALQSCMGAKGF